VPVFVREFSRILAAAVAKWCGAKCEYRSTIEKLRQPPSSMSSCKLTPLWTAHDAQVCLLCRVRHRRHYPERQTMPSCRWIGANRRVPCGHWRCWWVVGLGIVS